MTNPTPHGQVPEALIDLIDAYAETRHRCGGIYNARTEAARKAVIEALSGVQALSAAPAGWKLVPVEPTVDQEWAGKNAALRCSTMGEACKIYKAMLAASPPAAQPIGEVVVTKTEYGQIVSVTRQDDEGRILSVIATSDPAEQQAAPKAASAIGDELRDTLVAVSAAIAEQDDRTAQKMIREILAASPTPPAEQQAQPGAVYAELPQPDSWFHFTAQFWENKLRDFADRTHALRMQAATKAAPAWADQAVIEYRYTGGTHWCPLGPAERMKPDFDGVYRLQVGVYPVEQAAPKAAPATQQAGELVSVLKTVFEKCEVALNRYSQAPTDYHNAVLRLRDSVRDLIAAAAPQQEPASPIRIGWGKDYLDNGKPIDASAAPVPDFALAPQQEAQEPVAWESTILGYIKYITQAQYEKFRPNVRRWYKPYKCSNCSAPQPAPAPLSDDVVKDAARYRWLRDVPMAEWPDELATAFQLQQNAIWDAAIDAARKQGANHEQHTER